MVNLWGRISGAILAFSAVSSVAFAEPPEQLDLSASKQDALTAKCIAGQASSCVTVGDAAAQAWALSAWRRHYVGGTPDMERLDQALAYHLRACELGEVASCRWAGEPPPRPLCESGNAVVCDAIRPEIRREICAEYGVGHAACHPDGVGVASRDAALVLTWGVITNGGDWTDGIERVPLPPFGPDRQMASGHDALVIANLEGRRLEIAEYKADKVDILEVQTPQPDLKIMAVAIDAVAVADGEFVFLYRFEGSPDWVRFSHAEFRAEGLGLRAVWRQGIEPTATAEGSPYLDKERREILDPKELYRPRLPRMPKAYRGTQPVVPGRAEVGSVAYRWPTWERVPVGRDGQFRAPLRNGIASDTLVIIAGDHRVAREVIYADDRGQRILNDIQYLYQVVGSDKAPIVDFPVTAIFSPRAAEVPLEVQLKTGADGRFEVIGADRVVMGYPGARFELASTTSEKVISPIRGNDGPGIVDCLGRPLIGATLPIPGLVGPTGIRGNTDHRFGTKARIPRDGELWIDGEKRRWRRKERGMLETTCAVEVSVESGLEKKALAQLTHHKLPPDSTEVIAQTWRPILSELLYVQGTWVRATLEARSGDFQVHKVPTRTWRVLDFQRRPLAGAPIGNGYSTYKTALDGTFEVPLEAEGAFLAERPTLPELAQSEHEIVVVSNPNRKKVPPPGKKKSTFREDEVVSTRWTPLHWSEYGRMRELVRSWEEPEKAARLAEIEDPRDRALAEHILAREGPPYMYRANPPKGGHMLKRHPVMLSEEFIVGSVFDRDDAYVYVKVDD